MTGIVSIELIRLPCRQFADVSTELMSKEKDTVSHAGHRVGSRTKTIGSTEFSVEGE